MIRSAYSEPKRVAIDFDPDEMRTKQSFRDECDINNILQKYQRTGVLEHVRRFGGSYDFAEAIDFKEAMDIVATGNTMFAELPSSLRRRFGTPQAFLEFVQDDENWEEARKLGLVVNGPPVDSPEPVEGDPVPAPAGDDESG